MTSMGGWGGHVAQIGNGCGCAISVRVGVILALLVWPHGASAINIVPVLQNSKSQSPDFDPTKQGLAGLMSHAESYFEDIFEDSHTVQVNFWYEDLENSSIGFFSSVSTSGARITEANLRIDTRVGTGGAIRNWFIDPTPADDEEFDMQQDLWRDSGGEHFNFIAPSDLMDTFEVGYRGIPLIGSAASGKHDMLSTILHEFGHILGARGGSSENDDGDYDFDPAFVFGKNVAAKIDRNNGGAADPAHVLSQTMLMCGGCGQANARRRPSHADFFTIAAGNHFNDIDVPRREFYGGGTFNFNQNWSGGDRPGGSDDAFVRSGGVVVLNGNDSLANLTIEMTRLETGTHTLYLNGTVTVTGGWSSEHGRLMVSANGQVNAEDALIGSHGVIELTGGTLDVVNDMTITLRDSASGDDGLLTGHGVVNVGRLLNNRGLIQPKGGVLTLNADAIDLDGAGGGGHIDASGGDLVINGAITDPFDLNIDIGAAGAVTFNNGWSLGSSGTVTIIDGALQIHGPWQVNGTVRIDHTEPFGIVGIDGTGTMTVGNSGQLITSGAASLRAPAVIQGFFHVMSQRAVFSKGATFTDSSTVRVESDSTLELDNASLYTIDSAATFNGLGQIHVTEGAMLNLADGASLDIDLQNDGRLEIGSSAGNATVNGNFQQGASGALAIEIGGLIAAADYDRLAVAGSATIGGMLDVRRINDFVPSFGDSIVIVTAAAVSGTFAGVTGLSADGPLSIQVIYDPTQVILQLFPGVLFGDANNDGMVSGADLIAVHQNFGNLGPPFDGTLSGDANDDGQVTGADLIAVQQNFAIMFTATSPVPEPASLVILVLVVALCQRPASVLL